MNSLRALAGPGWKGHLCALLAGASLPAAFAPLDIWPLAVLAPATLLLLAWQLPPLAAVLRGWMFGAGMFGTGVSWVYVSIHDYGSAPVALAGFLTLVFCAGLALLPAITLGCWARWLRDRRGGILFGFPAAWILGEWCRSWLLTGFPWLYLGYSQVDGPLGGWAALVGVLGIGLILALSAAAVGLAAMRSRGAMIALAACVLLWLAAPLLQRIEWAEHSGTGLAVAMVQGNIAQELKWAPGHLDTTLATYATMSEPLWGTDLVVWPEAAVPAYFDLVTPFLGELAERAAGAGSSLLLGIPSRNANEERRRGFDAFNSVAVIGSDSGIYHKRRLVPFGEYVPLESWLRGMIAFFDLPMSSFSSGPAVQDTLTVRGLRVAPYICYEIVYPDLVAEGPREASVLLTVSNDTWFGASAGPLQHLQMARMRSMETARPLIRATNNGVSALIDHRGRILVRGGQFTREVISGSIQPMQGLTPFARWASWPVLLLCCAAIIALALGKPRRGREPTGLR
jgi:apolipoprotein N-acyltransferase